MRWTRSARQGEAGQSTLEWMAICAVVVGLVLALLAAAGDIGTAVQAAWEDQLCRVVGDCDGREPGDVASSDGGSASSDGGGAPSDDDGAGGDDGGILGGIGDALGGAVSAVGDAGSAVLDGAGDVVGGVVDGGGALLGGLVLGDYGDRYDNPVLEGLRIAGQVGSGILIVGDIRDGVHAIQEEDGVGLGLIAVGLIPVVGDGIRGAVNVGESVVDAGRAADDVVDAAGDASRAGDGAADDVAGTPPREAFCSFSAGTRVVLADGRAVPIASIAVGDLVLAGDPDAGWQARPVTALWVHDDLLVDLVTTAGRVTTTADHPFWNATDGAWQAAADLDRGDVLRSPDGTRVGVVGLDPRSARVDAAHNLTVDGWHTYVVRVGSADVLVHNQNTCEVPGGGLDAHEALGGHTIERHVARTDEELLARLESQPNISASSSFPDQATAEAAISEALSRNADDVDAFVGGTGPSVLVLQEPLGTTTGRSVARGSTEVQDVTGVRVVLRRDPSSPTGYRIQTAFPTP